MESIFVLVVRIGRKSSGPLYLTFILFSLITLSIFEPYRWSMKNMAFEGSHYACFLEGSIANKAVVSVAFH